MHTGRCCDYKVIHEVFYRWLSDASVLHRVSGYIFRYCHYEVHTRMIGWGRLHNQWQSFSRGAATGWCSFWSWSGAWPLAGSCRSFPWCGLVILYGYSDEIVRNVYKVQPSPPRLLSDCFSLTWLHVSSGLGLLCVPGIPWSMESLPFGSRCSHIHFPSCMESFSSPIFKAEQDNGSKLAYALLAVLCFPLTYFWVSFFKKLSFSKTVRKVYLSVNKVCGNLTMFRQCIHHHFTENVFTTLQNFPRWR